MTYPRISWEPAADEWLQQHGGSTSSLAILAHEFNLAAQEHNWHPRTKDAIKVRRYDLGLPPLRLVNRPVRCLDTGVVYPNAKAVAQALWVAETSVRVAIHRGNACQGYRWAYEDS